MIASESVVVEPVNVVSSKIPILYPVADDVVGRHEQPVPHGDRRLLAALGGGLSVETVHPSNPVCFSSPPKHIPLKSPSASDCLCASGRSCACPHSYGCLDKCLPKKPHADV